MPCVQGNCSFSVIIHLPNAIAELSGIARNLLWWGVWDWY